MKGVGLRQGARDSIHKTPLPELAAKVQRQSLGLAVVLSLIALRVGIGMHFFREGLNKFRDPKPFSAGFLGNAKGPWSDLFASHVWDRDGIARLDRDASLQTWSQFRAQAEAHFRFDDQQKKRAAALQKRTEEQLTEHLDKYAGDIEEYRQNLARRDRYRSDRQRMETPSLRDQVEKIDSEIRSKRTKLLAPIDLIWQAYARDLNALATPDQRQRGLLDLAKPGRQRFDSESIDAFIPWFDATVGVLLIVGLATRPAAFAAALFLGSVVVSQWPTAPDAAPTWAQFIEALGLLVVAATGAGQFAGLDGIFSAVCCRPWRSPDQRSSTRTARA